MSNQKTLINVLNTGRMKSYELINAPLEPASVQIVAQVANKLKSMGFVIMTARFGNAPSITVKPTEATRQLESVYTGQHSDKDGRMYNSYAAGFEGVKIVWYKLKRPEVMH